MCCEVDEAKRGPCLQNGHYYINKTKLWVSICTSMCMQVHRNLWKDIMVTSGEGGEMRQGRAG